MDDYTPTTEEVRWQYADAFLGDGSIVSLGEARSGNLADFDRWLAERDRQVAERAWERGRIFGAENWSAVYDPDEYNPYRLAPSSPVGEETE